MTDTWTPSPAFGSANSQQSNGEVDVAQQISSRVKLLANTSPWLAQNPDALQALATNPTLSNVDLATQSAAMTGQIAADTMATSMKKMDASAQRLVWSNMTGTQRAALTQLGYAGPPKVTTPGFLEDTFGAVGRIASDVLTVPGHALTTAGGELLHGLQIVGDQPSHLYRAIRTMDDTSQEVALGGALVGILGIAAAPFTGGLSLGMTAAAFGGGALLGATAGAALTNPSDWVDAMRNTYDGEHVFTRDSQKQARTILGNDSTLGNLAKDIAYDGSLYELATDFASTRDATAKNTMLKTVDKIARKIVDPGDPRYAQVTNGLVKVISDPNFMKAVNTLQMGKISFGRDLARGVGLTPGSGLYSAVSGAADGLFVVTLDPTLALGAVGEWNKVRRFGVPLVEEAGETSARIAHLFETQPAVQRYADILSDGINRADPQYIKNMLPDAQALVPDLLEYKNELRSTGQLDGPFTRDNLLDWYKRGDGIKAMAAGRGTVKAEAEIIFPHMGTGSYAWAQSKNLVKAAIDFADDNHLNAIARRMDEGLRPGVGALAPEAFVNAAEGATPAFQVGQAVQLNADRYRLLKTGIDIVDKIPVLRNVERSFGALLGSATTMVPETGAIALAGSRSALDIDKFVDLGRVVGMTRDDRAMWKAFMLDQANPGMRAVASESFLDSMLTAGGLKNLPEGVALNDKFMIKYHQSYALGGLDEYIVGGRLRKVGVLPVADQALELVTPDLKVLRQALKKQTITKYLLNAGDAHFIDTAMNKVWKPAVLLRLGFIPRAAGEELLAFMARVGPSHILADAGERAIAQGKFATDPSLLAQRLGKDTLSASEFAKTKEWLSLAHVRPLERMFARGNWEEPIQRVLHGYSQWVRDGLEGGLFDESTIAKLPDSIRTAALGKDRGLRNFILSGSDREMQEAAQLFQSRFGDTLMRSVSASNAGMYDRGVRQNLIPHEVPDAANPGQFVTEMYLESRGQFVNYERGDWQYNNAIHEQLQRTISDPIVGGVYGDILTRHAPDFEGLGEREAADLAAHYEKLTNGPAAINQVTREFLDGKPMTTVEWDAFRSTLKHTGELNDRQIGELRTILPDGDITHDEMLEALDRVLTKSNQTAKVKALRSALPDAKLMANRLGALDDTARGWLAPFLEHGAWTPETLADGSYYIAKDAIDPTADQRMAEALAHPANQDAIKTSMYGVQTPTDAVVRNPVPSGVVRVYNPALSPTSTEKLQAAITALGEPGVDGIDNVHAAVDALMAQWKRTTSAIGGDLSRYDDVAENFFSTLVQKHDQLADLAATTERMDKTGLVPISMYAVDDPNIAGALSATMRDFVGATQETGLNRAVSYMDVNRRVGDLRSVHVDGLAAPFRSAAGSTGWQVDSAMLHGRAEIVPPTAEFEHMDGQWTFGTSAEQSMDEWSKVIRERVNQVTRSGVKRQFFARGDRPLFKNVREGLSTRKVEVAAGEELAKGREYIDEAGKIVRWGDSRHMDSVASQAENAPIMWDVVGPALRDTLDEARGSAIYTADGKRIFRSKVDQIADSDARQLPDGALGVMNTPYKQGTWDKVVSAGFDKVISPAIDAIVRKPLAFHEFANAYRQSKNLHPLLMDGDLINRLIPTHFAGSVASAFATDADRARVLADARSISHLFDDPEHIRQLSDDALLQTLDGMGEQGVVKLRDRADLTTSIEQIPGGPDYEAAKRLTDLPEGSFRYMQSPESGMNRNLQFTKDSIAKVGKSINAPWSIAKTHTAVGSLERGSKADRQLFRALDEGGWELLQRADTNLKHVQQTIGDLAVERAISNTIPFLDSHEVRSQMSEYGKQLAPFWYAEENFMKRWANTLRIAPEALRKGQLTYMGMKSVGVVRTDQAGRDWFVYPGSGVLAEALGKLPGMSILPIGAMLQAQPQNMLPGFNRVGVPSASPLITFPMDVATSLFPELRPLQTAVASGQGVSQGIARHIIPTQIYNVWEAAFGNENSSPRYASAMASAAAYMEASGHGLPDDADANTTDEYMRTLKSHARTIMLTQALVGFVAPGSPQQVITGNTGGIASSLTGIGVEDVNKTFRSEYLNLIREQGIEQGTATYMAYHPKGDLEDIVNPLAFTVGQTQTSSGGVLPATAQAVKFYDDNTDYLNQFPDAAGYLLPPDQNGSSDAGDLNAYTEQTIAGLRKRRTPAEFLQAIKYKEGSYEYYRSKDIADQLIGQADAAGDTDRKAIITANWQSWAAIYKAQHPVFADQLESSDGRQRRADTLQQLRVALNDPAAPTAWHTGALKQMVSDFDAYQGALSTLADDRTARAQAQADQIRAAYKDYMAGQVIKHPELAPFWTSVLRPESNS